MLLTLKPEGARIKEQNTILDPILVKEIFEFMPAKEVDSALEGIECLARFARVVLRRRKRERDS